MRSIESMDFNKKYDFTQCCRFYSLLLQPTSVNNFIAQKGSCQISIIDRNIAIK